MFRNMCQKFHLYLAIRSTKNHRIQTLGVSSWTASREKLILNVEMEAHLYGIDVFFQISSIMRT